MTTTDLITTKAHAEAFTPQPNPWCKAHPEGLLCPVLHSCDQCCHDWWDRDRDRGRT